MSANPDHPDPAIRETPAHYETPSDTDTDRVATDEEKQKWVQSWRTAAVELARIDDEELRQLDDDSVLASITGTSLPVVDEVEVGERNGLVTLQAWFTRFRLLQLERTKKTE
jgi:hypothetical protein